ncbi:MAG: AIR synthase related protein, partial [Kiloniellales bacterium]|nr:AIR synthase related protein [Kiloniellales bacterium]
LDFAIIGRLTDTGRMVLKMNGEVVGDLPIDPLAEASPEYDRPWTAPEPRPELAPEDVAPPEDANAALLTLLGSPDHCSKRWVWEQYDHMVMADTVRRPGGDAAVVRIHGSNRGLAVAIDCTPRYCAADPRRGGAQAAAESWRNLTAVGARPLAITDNLNFGNPERPRIMGQFVGCIEGMGEACRALDYPVVSGNVSLYNETNGEAILPTPAIGGVGLIDDLGRIADAAFKADGEAIVLVGETRGHLGASSYLRVIEGRAGLDAGAPPPVDLTAERRNGDFVRGLIAAGRVTACHDVSDGGLAVALAEMALGGNRGAEITGPDSGSADSPPIHAWLFGEDQARYIVTMADSAALLASLLAGAEAAGVPAVRIGTTGGTALILPGGGPISLDDLRRAHEAWLPAYMDGA